MKAFLYLILFLQIFIPKQAKHAKIIKIVYLKEMPVEFGAKAIKMSVQTQWIDIKKFE